MRDKQKPDLFFQDDRDPAGGQRLSEVNPLSIFGSLQDLSLADIIQIIAGSQKTGVLYVNSSEGRSTIAFKNGFVVSASKPDLAHRLGQLLRRQNDISEIELEMCLKEQHQTGRPLGEILLERLLVTRDQLRATMRMQVMETINEIVNLEEGSFSFHPDSQLPQDQIAYDPQHLLLDVAFLQDTSGYRKRAAQGDLFSPEKLLVGMEDKAEIRHLEGSDIESGLEAVNLLHDLSEELARPRESTEVSLIVLRLAAEFLDRCLFLVKSGETFVVCGGFGFDFRHEAVNAGPGLNTVIPLRAASVFTTVYDAKRSYRGPLLEGAWGKDLIERLTRHLPSEIVVLPIICQAEVIALLYGDNGEGQERIPSTELLEILMLQAGMALENSQLREKLLQLTQRAFNSPSNTT